MSGDAGLHVPCWLPGAAVLDELWPALHSSAKGHKTPIKAASIPLQLCLVQLTNPHTHTHTSLVHEPSSIPGGQSRAVLCRVSVSPPCSQHVSSVTPSPSVSPPCPRLGPGRAALLQHPGQRHRTQAPPGWVWRSGMGVSSCPGNPRRECWRESGCGCPRGTRGCPQEAQNVPRGLSLPSGGLSNGSFCPLGCQRPAFVVYVPTEVPVPLQMYRWLRRCGSPCAGMRAQATTHIRV